MPTDGDTPWHLAEGKLLLRRWSSGDLDLGGTDSFSWTARGGRWHPNSWGADAVLAAVHDIGGWAGLAGLRLLLLAAVVALTWAATRHSHAGGWARAGATWVSAVLLIPFSALRPQLATFALVLLCLELTTLALDAGTAGTGRHSLRRVLFALALIVILWAALHGGVVVGVIAVAAACAGHAVDQRTWRQPALVTAIALAASCLSPLGPRVWTYAVTVGAASRRELIEEWQPPSIHRADDVAVAAFLLVVVIAGLWARRSGAAWARWRVLLPALVLTASAFVAVRNAAVAVLAAAPLTAAALGTAGGWLGRRGWSLPVHPGRAIGAMTVGALLGGAVQSGEFTLQVNPLGSTDYPSVSALALPSGCRLLNEYHDGGYLILARPDVPVSQDGRNDLYGHAKLQDQRALLGDGDPARAVSALEQRGITCVLAAPGRGLIRALAVSPQWRRVAADEQAEAWIRSPGRS